MTYTWVLVEDGQIVCAFTSEPTDDEVLEVANDMTGEAGIFYEKIDNNFFWTNNEGLTTEFTLTKTELL
jgi:hypothetical protein